MIHSKILSIYNELELFVQNLFHGMNHLVKTSSGCTMWGDDQPRCG